MQAKVIHPRIIGNNPSPRDVLTNGGLNIKRRGKMHRMVVLNASFADKKLAAVANRGHIVLTITASALFILIKNLHDSYLVQT
jgi:hypothetical protein